jgi:Domain of unknown function (DUF5060)/Protein of unknown function (DUF4038)
VLIQATERSSLWDVAEVVLTTRSEYGNPFRDVSVRATFRGPSGREVDALGFHDGGAVWRVRLMPDEEGDWSFRTHSTDPELDGVEGVINVGPAGADRHGAVRVDGIHHFAHADSTPYFLLGTTLYMGLSHGREALNRTVTQLSESPFNKARFMLQGGMLTGSSTRTPFPSAADGAPDYERFDVEFYRELEDGLRQLSALGVEADLILFIPYFDFRPPTAAVDVRPSNMGSVNDLWYVRYTSARLSAFAHVWWTIANEFDLFKVQKDWDELAAAIQEGDPYGHLLSNHHSILGFFDNSRPWITHVNLQDVLLQRHAAGPHHLGELTLDAYAIGKPVVVDEYGYEGNNGFTSARRRFSEDASAARPGALRSAAVQHGAASARLKWGSSGLRV